MTWVAMPRVFTSSADKASNVPFDTDFIKFKIVDKKVPKRKETVRRSLVEIAGKSTVRTAEVDDKLLLVERGTAGGIPYGWRTPTS